MYTETLTQLSMDILEETKPKVPEILTARLPENIKGDIGDLMLLEKRKISHLAIMLIEESIPVKMKIHAHKHEMVSIYKNSVEVVRTQRIALDGENANYKSSPGLFISFNDHKSGKLSGFNLSKAEALTMAANLSIFLNEVNL